MLIAKIELNVYRAHFGEDCRTRVTILQLTTIPILSITRDDSLMDFHLVQPRAIYLSFVKAQYCGCIFGHEH